MGFWMANFLPEKRRGWRRKLLAGLFITLGTILAAPE